VIQAELLLDEAGLLCSCRVSGHAGAGEFGSDIVCAAVSVLTRTFVRVLGDREGVTLRGDAQERGSFLVEVEYGSDGREFLAAAGAFLMEGLLSVSTEFPDNCKLIIERRN
jgi:uncharacterized protein YsxB (DUF464 family)